MHRQNLAITAALLACATIVAPVFGADKLTGQLIKAYNAGHYLSAEQLGEEVVARRPGDYSARYYLANSYVMLHKNEQAIGQYRICLNSGTSGQLQEYSRTALERLLKQKEQTLVAVSQVEQPKDREIKEFKKRLRQENKEEEQNLRQEWNQALARINGNSGFGYGGRRGFFGGFGRRQGFDSESYKINEYYSKKLAALANYEESMLSQANCGTGKIRIAPSLSSSKVKNYINYGDESEAADIPVDNPLHAQARLLGDAAPQLPGQTAGRKPAHQAKPGKGKAAAKMPLASISPTNIPPAITSPATIPPASKTAASKTAGHNSGKTTQ